MMVTDHIHGGYKMDDNEIATFIMIVAVVQLIYQVRVSTCTCIIGGYLVHVHVHR